MPSSPLLPSTQPVPGKRLLVCSAGLSTHVETEVHLGIRRFALTRPDWELGYLSAAEANTLSPEDLHVWNLDGIFLLVRPQQTPVLLQLPSPPLILIDLYHTRPKGIPRIEIDDDAIGARAAEYFLGNRFEHFAVAISADSPAYATFRARGFTLALAARHLTPLSFQLRQFADRPWQPDPDLNTWLLSLPFPVALYCTQDAVALHVLNACQHLGLRVPDDISILGTDNHPLLCESVRPFLSSIRQPHQLAGYRAAEYMQQLTTPHPGATPPPLSCEAIDACEIIERQSTSLRAIPDPAIAKAVAHLRQHALDDGSIDIAAQAAGLNRRALERGIKRHLGVTPGQYVIEVKIDHAKHLLTHTNQRMWEIAEACNMTQEHFATLFRKNAGMTPSAFRRTRQALTTPSTRHQ